MSVAIATAQAHYADLKIAPERITRNSHLSKHFDEIQFILTYSDFIVDKYVLHGIYHHEYRFYEFQTFVWIRILFKPSWKNSVIMDITGV